MLGSGVDYRGQFKLDHTSGTDKAKQLLSHCCNFWYNRNYVGDVKPFHAAHNENR